MKEIVIILCLLCIALGVAVFVLFRKLEDLRERLEFWRGR